MCFNPWWLLNQHAFAKVPSGKLSDLLFEQQHWFFSSCTFDCLLAFIVSESQDVPGVLRKEGCHSSAVNTENYSGTLVQLRSVEFLLGLSFGRQDEGNVPAELPGQCGWRRRLVKSNIALLSASCPHVFICWILCLFFWVNLTCFARKESVTPFSAPLFFLLVRLQFVSETYIFFSSTQIFTLSANNIAVALRTRITSVMSPL